MHIIRILNDMSSGDTFAVYTDDNIENAGINVSRQTGIDIHYCAVIRKDVFHDRGLSGSPDKPS